MVEGGGLEDGWDECTVQTCALWAKYLLQPLGANAENEGAVCTPYITTAAADCFKQQHGQCELFIDKNTTSFVAKGKQHLAASA